MRVMKPLLIAGTMLLLHSSISRAQVLGRRVPAPIPEATLQALLNEASGEHAYAHTRYLSSFAREPNSAGFHRAAEYVADQAQKIGLSKVRIEAFEVPQPSWDVDRATLVLISPSQEKLADTDQVGVSLCRFSNAAEVEADLVDVGEGTSEQDYAGKEVRGKIVLASGHPMAVQAEAVIKRDAVGLVSYHANSFFGVRPSDDAVSWASIRPRMPGGEPAGFGFMLSPNDGARLRDRLRRGEGLRVRASVKVRTRSPGKIEMVTAELPGANPQNDDIVFSAHLDHQNPGANDNASGSAALLEIARTVQALIKARAIEPPQRTLRFWWVTEIQGTYRYFFDHPEEARKISFDINIDQAGGDKHYRNDLVYIKTPRWLPSFVDDAFDLICEYMQTYYADVYHAPSELFVAPTGRQDEPLTYRAWEYARLTDHIVFETAGMDVPSISLAYPSFHYIHTSEDGIEHIDATTLKRSVVLASIAGLYLATPSEGPRTPFESEVIARLRASELRTVLRAQDLLSESTSESVHDDYLRAAAMVRSAAELSHQAIASFARLGRNQGVAEATSNFSSSTSALRSAYEQRCQQLGVEPRPGDVPNRGEGLGLVIPRRIVELGPDYRQWLRSPLPDLSNDVATELKSFIDGRRSVTGLWQRLVAEHPEVTLEQVVAGVQALASRGWVELRQAQP